MTHALDSSQRFAARVVGFGYLLAMATAIFGESYVRGSLIVNGDAMRTAQNIAEHRLLFRLGIAGELLTFASDIALIVALYVILAPIHRHLALFATAIRLVAETVCVTMAAHSFDVLRILGGADDMKAFDPEQLAALARVSLGAHGAAYGTAFVFLGIGSAVFGYLWIRSRYLPLSLGVLGVVAPLLLGGGSFAILMWPGLNGALYPWFMVPMFFFEVGTGLLLAWRGLREPAPPEVERWERRVSGAESTPA